MSTGGSTYPDSPAPRKKLLPAVILIALWIPIVVAGLVLLWSYSTTAGSAGNPPAVWPAGTDFSRTSNSMALVMIVHPHCPCSRASIGELSALMAHAQSRLQAWVVFVRPRGFQEDWAKTDLWRSASAIPGVRTIVDHGGREARRFGAETSGETLLFDAKGKLLFAGGITGARGHYGDNAGLSAVIDMVDQQGPQEDGKRAVSANARSAVYGCPLFAPSKVRDGGGKRCSW